ncbi:hypothetical protein FGB62_176g04 [Gracilaria domingensis]|nr:hypothetical protein FGB62_176g04 [Gracilaria domingensis]
MPFSQLIDNNQIEKDGDRVDVEANDLEVVWTTYQFETSPLLDDSILDWFVESAWSQSNSLSEAVSGDLPFLGLGFVLLASRAHFPQYCAFLRVVRSGDLPSALSDLEHLQKGILVRQIVAIPDLKGNARKADGGAVIGHDVLAVGERGGPLRHPQLVGAGPLRKHNAPDNWFTVRNQF